MAVVSGGTTLIDNGTLDAGVSTGSLILLSTQTASASASIEFTSGIDSTYDSYVFKFINMHNNTDNSGFGFQADTGTNTNYNQTITSTFFRAFHNEADFSSLDYITSLDQAQGTGLQYFGSNIGNASDENLNGTLQLFQPSSSVFVKHFISTFNFSLNNEGGANPFIAGYINTTTPITRVQFKPDTGTFDGIIKMYGVK